MVEEISRCFDKNGFHYEIIREYGNICIFKQLKGEKVYGYETMILRLVFHRQPSKTGVWETSKDKKRWRFPSNEEFGRFGWSYSELKNAEAKFLALTGNKG